MNRHYPIRRTRPPPRVGAIALGALALGALAVGALAIGWLAIGRLAVGRAHFRSIDVDELTVRRLRVIETASAPLGERKTKA